MLLNKRELAGFSVSPLLAPIAYYFVLSWPSPFEINAGNSFDALFVTILMGVPIAYLITLVVGIPVFIFLRKQGWLNLIIVMLVAGIIAILPIMFSEMVNGTILNYTKNKFIIDMGYFLSGLAVGFLFWFIAIWKTDSVNH